MDIEHNSRKKFYRFPFGAVTCGGEVRLRLAVSGAGIPSAVRLLYGGWQGRSPKGYAVYF